MRTEARPRTPGLPIAGGSVVTVGTFDGVHTGHRDLLQRLARRAGATGLPSLLVTFEPHPLDVVDPAAAPMLLTPAEEKLEELAQTPLDYVAVLPFTPALARYSAAQFVEHILLGRFAMRELLVGYDHGLGRGREGGVDVLRGIGERHGFRVDVIDAVLVDAGTPASSSAVRRAVAHGDLDTAARGLGRRYSFRGRVVTGSQRGRTLGYPTLNVSLPSPRKLLPPTGVYAVLAETPRGMFGGMMNLGPRPTFDDERVTLEVHLFDAGGDWYGADVRVQFVARLRGTIRFDGVDALVAQLARDAENARGALTQVEELDTLRGSAENPPSLP